MSKSLMQILLDHMVNSTHPFWVDPTAFTASTEQASHPQPSTPPPCTSSPNESASGVNTSPSSPAATGAPSSSSPTAQSTSAGRSWTPPKLTRPVIYISGPYTSNPGPNTLTAMRLFKTLWDKGFAPICPHWSHFQNILTPMSWEQWIEYDLHLLGDGVAGVFHILGPSEGAKIEVAYAKKLNIPVFTDIHQMVKHFFPVKQRTSPLVIGFMGSPGTGKTTTRDFLADLLNDHKKTVVKLSFADPIRAALKVMGITKQGTNDPLYRAGGTALSALRSVNPDFYVDKIKQIIASYSPNTIVLIDDVRYENEMTICDQIFHLSPDGWDPPNAGLLSHPSEMLCNEINRIGCSKPLKTDYPGVRMELERSPIPSFWKVEKHRKLLVEKGCCRRAAVYILDVLKSKDLV